MDMLESWLDESYRAQAPKKLSAQLDGTPASRAANSTKKKATTKKTASRSQVALTRRPPERATRTATTTRASPVVGDRRIDLADHEGRNTQEYATELSGSLDGMMTDVVVRA